MKMCEKSHTLAISAAILCLISASVLLLVNNFSNPVRFGSDVKPWMDSWVDLGLSPIDCLMLLIVGISLAIYLKLHYELFHPKKDDEK